MGGTEILLKGVPSRARPQKAVDNYRDGIPARYSPYGEQYMESLIQTKHLLADEGSYFVANNGQANLNTGATQTAFNDTTSGFILLWNGEPAGGKRYYIDYARLIAITTGSSGANVQAAVRIDQSSRFSASGTEITANIVNPNGDDSSKSNARVWSGGATALALTAKTASQRLIVGNLFLKGAIPAAGDTYMLSFGSVDMPTTFGSASTVLPAFSQNPVPPVILAPGWSLIIDLWLASQTAASSYLPEIGWWER